MGFFAPAGLAFAAIIPIIILMYLLKRRRQDVTVSSTYLWNQILKDVRANAPWQRLKRNLLMFIQILAAVFLVLAAARPFIPVGKGQTSHVLVMIDVSGSMQGTDESPSRIARAKARAQDLIAQLGPGDRMSLVSIGSSPRVLASASDNQGSLQAAVRSIETTFEEADLSQALSLAGSMAKGDERFRAVIIGDSNLAIPGELPKSFPITVLTVGGKAENLALEALAAREVGGATAVLARVANHGTRERDFTLELRRNGQLVDARGGRAPAGGSTEIVWQDLQEGGDHFEARIVEEDDLPADNTSWTVAARAAKFKALMVSRSNLFLEKAIALRPEAELYKTTPEDYQAGDYKVYIFDGWLPDELPQAALVVLNPPDGTNLLPVGEAVKITNLRPAGAVGLVQHVSLDDVRVARSRKLEVPSWGQTVIDSPETPVLIAGETGGRRVAVLGFDLHESDLPLRTAFPILTQNILGWLVPPPAAASAAIAGNSLNLNLDPLAEEVWVSTPGGERVKVAPPLPAPPWTRTSELGIYQLEQIVRGQAVKTFFAVNFPTAESGLPVLDSSGIQEVDATGSSPRSVKVANRELWMVAAWVALALLAVEWWVYARES